MIMSCLPIEEKIINIVSAVLTTPIEDWTEISWEESMLPGIDMLHHYGPLNRSNNSTSNTTATDANTSHELFDYNRFRKHFAVLFERIVRLATVDVTVVPVEKPSTTETSAISSLDQLALDTGIAINAEDELKRSKSRNKDGAARGFTLEAVEDDEDEYDEEDLRNVNRTESEKRKQAESSEWVNENFELPSSEELFNDLGIWW